MICYFAPMEGITGYGYRNAHHALFPGLDAYYTPFIVAGEQRKFKRREMADVLPENNSGVPVVPQILTNRADALVFAVEYLEDLGYREVNLNLGCPMPTVTNKRKGAGALKDPDALSAFFDEVFDALSSRQTAPSISIKTRLGFYGEEEVDPLFSLFGKYPFSKVILHARYGVQAYRGTCDLAATARAAAHLSVPVIYNGDIRGTDDIARVETYFHPAGIMIGRGLLADPALYREMTGGKELSMEELRAFTELLLENTKEQLSGAGEVPVINRMKEVWAHLFEHLEDPARCGKAIRKAQNLQQYEAAVRTVWANCRIRNLP